MATADANVLAGAGSNGAVSIEVDKEVVVPADTEASSKQPEQMAESEEAHAKEPTRDEL
jgi:hypothetical protein